MKMHTKKKKYRQEMQRLAKAGKINTAEGKMVDRHTIPESSMRRDYFPQG